MPARKEEMTLLEHIKELRERLFRAAISLVVMTLLTSFFVDYAVAWLVRPLGSSRVIVLSPTEAPIIYFKIAMVMGLGLALPYVLYQFYGFIAPGLYPKERKTFILAVPAVLVFFILGAMFTLQVLIPVSLPVLKAFFSTVVEPTYSLESYLSFVSTLVLWMGLLFQTPLVIYLIARLGFVTPQQLSQGRRLVIIIAAVVAAVITPTTDPVTMLMVTGPFVVLYEIGIMLARIAMRQRPMRTRPESQD
jgi:sec-independent protein translocase protein TatC